ncbi:winged helix-turn-helix domain-containing protein [Halobacterium sp. CBA1126]|uniref:ArsR/SmtB family transcription factor n=1 Tax=Halobacterium sp. CBA1126 TaxID=2668074 RepID=UPI0012FC45BE|nr:winged helix-turn-helix domain-containing protein [Halobacterium sp. CBA1126]MUV60725.1 helix-turn-helix domain-containing protein [Halobacterium sp. CBA1126]
MFPPQDAHADVGPRVVDLSADDGAAVDALSSETARAILDRLRESPATVATLAEVTDTSPQNVHYHLDNLQAADVVTSVDAVDDESGCETAVYAPAGDPLVIVSGDADRDELERVLERALSAVAAFAVVGVVAQRVLAPAPTFVGGEHLGGYGGSAPPVGAAIFTVGLLAAVAYAFVRVRQLER